MFDCIIERGRKPLVISTEWRNLALWLGFLTCVRNDKRAGWNVKAKEWRENVVAMGLQRPRVEQCLTSLQKATQSQLSFRQHGEILCCGSDSSHPFGMTV